MFDHNMTSPTKQLTKSITPVPKALVHE